MGVQDHNLIWFCGGPSASRLMGAMMRRVCNRPADALHVQDGCFFAVYVASVFSRFSESLVLVLNGPLSKSKVTQSNVVSLSFEA